MKYFNPNFKCILQKKCSSIGTFVNHHSLLLRAVKAHIIDFILFCEKCYAIIYKHSKPQEQQQKNLNEKKNRCIID